MNLSERGLKTAVYGLVGCGAGFLVGLPVAGISGGATYLLTGGDFEAAVYVASLAYKGTVCVGTGVGAVSGAVGGE